MKVDIPMDIIETTRKVFSEPNFTKNLSEHGQIVNVYFSPFDWSQDLLLIGFEKKILLSHLEISNDNIDVTFLTEFMHPCRCTTLSFSPVASITTIPNQILFCTGGNDFKLRIYSSDLLDNNTCKVLHGHTSYINDSMFDSENSYLASTSDDNTVKVWSVEDFKLKLTFHLTSPGINVSWHRMTFVSYLSLKKIGIIRFYNVETETPILSLDYGKQLSSCHWAPSDRDLVASLQLGELLIWEIPKPCLPLHSSILFPENGGNLKFSPQGELVAAVNSLDSSLKIVHVKTQAVKLTATVTLPTNVCWHYRYPIVCIGDDTKLCFWKVSGK
ncbi:hypothetical protein NQ317_013848 [Molorchus minor]|uniref:Nucleoporin Nup37 n=1 Tax=Molorchus minor TaxID=1323400 RepID=A0ABQ9J3U1_9CUCU|nr:hypothetical protein NQ317_013848 [Molorchus minor]